MKTENQTLAAMLAEVMQAKAALIASAGAEDEQTTGKRLLDLEHAFMNAPIRSFGDVLLKARYAKDVARYELTDRAEVIHDSIAAYCLANLLDDLDKLAALPAEASNLAGRLEELQATRAALDAASGEEGETIANRLIDQERDFFGAPVASFDDIAAKLAYAKTACEGELRDREVFSHVSYAAFCLSSLIGDLESLPPPPPPGSLAGLLDQHSEMVKEHEKAVIASDAPGLSQVERETARRNAAEVSDQREALEREIFLHPVATVQDMALKARLIAEECIFSLDQEPEEMGLEELGYWVLRRDAELLASVRVCPHDKSRGLDAAMALLSNGGRS